MTLSPGVRVRRNDPRRLATGRVVRVEGEWAVVKWDAGSVRLTSIRVADVHDGAAEVVEVHADGGGGVSDERQKRRLEAVHRWRSKPENRERDRASIKARARVLERLRLLHQDEFNSLLREERAALGLPVFGEVRG